MEDKYYKTRTQLLKTLLTYGNKTTNLANELYGMMTESSKRKFLSMDKSGAKYDDDDGYYYNLSEKNYADKNIRAYICFGDKYFDDTSLNFKIGKDDEKHLTIGFYYTGIVDKLHNGRTFKHLRKIINDFEKQNGRLTESGTFITYEGRKKINGFASVYTIHTVELLKTDAEQYVIVSYDRVYEYFNQSAEEQFSIKNFNIEIAPENEDYCSLEG